MDWIKWLIPLIALAVYILSNMAKEREETRRPLRPLPPPLPPPQDTGDRPKRSPSEVDRFLEEVRRRREETAKPAEAKPAAPRPVAERQPVAERPAVEQRPRPQRPAPAEALSRPRPSGKEEPVKQQRPPARRPAAGQEAIPVVQLASLPAAVPSLLAPPQPSPELGTVHLSVPPARAVSPAAQQLMELLKTPQTLRTAFLLREVFEPPRCRRAR